MEWCSCGQRPPAIGEDRCFLCIRRSIEQVNLAAPGVARDEFDVYRLHPPPPNGVITLVFYALVTCCLAFVLGLGILVGWILRGLSN